ISCAGIGADQSSARRSPCDRLVISSSHNGSAGLVAATRSRNSCGVHVQTLSTQPPTREAEREQRGELEHRPHYGFTTQSVFLVVNVRSEYISTVQVNVPSNVFVAGGVTTGGVTTTGGATTASAGIVTVPDCPPPFFQLTV